jgi:ribosomal protein S18 acetylase RimI-like enzyme
MEAPPEVVIRRMQTVEEAEVCARLMAGSEPWLTLRRPFDDNFKLLRDPAKEGYVAFFGNQFLGFVLVHLHGPLNGYLPAIAVTPQARSAGIGLKLIQFAEERIFQHSPNVFLCVSSFNTRARKLYEQLGYERVGEFKDYIVTGHSEILMRKTRGPIAEFPK